MSDNPMPAEVDIQQFRGKKGDMERYFRSLFGDDLGGDYWVMRLHRECNGNISAMVEFLGFAGMQRMIEECRRLNLPALGQENKRRTSGHEADDLSTEELLRQYRSLSKCKEKALRYNWKLLGQKFGLLMPVADVHFCSLLCDVERLATLCDWIKRRPKYVRWFGAGDLFDLPVKNSKAGSTGRQFCSLHRGIDAVTELLGPVKEQCVGLGLGNHDARLMVSEEVNWDPVRQVCNNLGVEYLGYWKHIVHEVGPQTYTMLYHHGKGAARTAGSKLMSGLQIGDTTTDELVVSAHLHDENAKKSNKRHTDTETLDVDNVTQHNVQCPSFLDYGDYAAEKALSPSSLGTVGIELRADVHNLHVRS